MRTTVTAWRTAPTHKRRVADDTFVYRQLGPDTSIPLGCLPQGFAAAAAMEAGGSQAIVDDITPWVNATFSDDHGQSYPQLAQDCAMVIVAPTEQAR